MLNEEFERDVCSVNEPEKSVKKILVKYIWNQFHTKNCYY